MQKLDRKKENTGENTRKDQKLKKRKIKQRMQKEKE